ncbi:PREDICTED: glutamate decarboxylase 1 [Pygoscelis adeliae]|nr:PREDICTED: glutamate decarboxylase 1 [Pygoscelis adeliae]
MASSAPSSSNDAPDPTPTNLRPTSLERPVSKRNDKSVKPCSAPLSKVRKVLYTKKPSSCWERESGNTRRSKIAQVRLQRFGPRQLTIRSPESDTEEWDFKSSRAALNPPAAEATRISSSRPRRASAGGPAPRRGAVRRPAATARAGTRQDTDERFATVMRFPPGVEEALEGRLPRFPVARDTGLRWGASPTLPGRSSGNKRSSSPADIPSRDERWFQLLVVLKEKEEKRRPTLPWKIRISWARAGFLQRTNSLEDKGRIVSSLKERQSSKSLLACENSEKESRFRRTETDFSNLYARDLLPAKNGEEQTMQFLLEVVDILLNYVRKTFDRSTKVLDFHHPHQLLEGMEGFNLELSDNPESLEQILVDCRDTLKYGVRTGHPRFFNQLSTGLDIIGLAGEWLTSTANTNMFTYEIAPVFVLMEQITLQKMREIIGWSNKDGDGIFSPGGAISNMYSIMAARYKYFPEVKTKGMAAVPKLVLFTSEHSHYSIKKAGAALGFGTDNVILIKCNERGKIIPADLEAKILEAKQKGYIPLFVNATAGTTVYGAFDPIQEIADICEKYNLWLHVDAAWGGGLLMSRKHRHKLNGIERANSVTWNPHKMMGVLLQCSAILVREKGILQGCNQMCAGYLFQQDKQYDVSYDTGDKAIQCGRHVDIFKFWLMWKAKGTVGFEYQINKCLELAEYLYTKIKNREEFEMVFEGEPEHTNVCFWYIPPSLRGMPDCDERREKLHRVAPKIKALMMESGTTMVGYQPQGDKVNFFRMVISNPAATKSDIDFLIEEIERLGQEL